MAQLTSNIKNMPFFNVFQSAYLQLPKALLLIEILMPTEECKYTSPCVFTLEGKKIISSLDFDQELRVFLSPGFNNKGYPITLDEFLSVRKTLYEFKFC